MLRRVHRYSLVSDLCLRVHMSIPEYNVNKTKTRPKQDQDQRLEKDAYATSQRSLNSIRHMVINDSLRFEEYWFW